jgi:L-ascorbate metabolism protein UlaG (beta-lactamase superfamily)
MRTSYWIILCLIAVFNLFGADAAAQETKLKWHGHAAFSIKTPKGTIILIDPWLANPKNPDAGAGKDPLAGLPRAD